MSAYLSRISASSPVCGTVTMPIEAETCSVAPSTVTGVANSPRIRSASALASRRSVARGKQDELVAAEAREAVLLAGDTLKPLRHDAQQLIADGVTERVVDLLEAIEVDPQQRRRVGTTAQFEQLFEAALERETVAQPGQAVDLGQPLEALCASCA